MKLLLTALLCLLLSACAPPAEPAPAEMVPAFQEAADSLQSLYGNTVEAVFLPFEDIRQFFPLDEGLLLVSGRKLIVLDEALTEKAVCALDFDGEIRLAGKTISAFDPENGQLLLLDSALNELRRITLPSDLTGSPVLSYDGSTLFFRTGTSLYRWDLGSGIRRRIREFGSELEILVDIHWFDTVLQCRSGQNDLFMDAQTGQLLQTLERPARLITLEDRYYCTFSAGFVENRVFGTGTQAPQCLLPETHACTFLPESHGAVTLEPLPDGDTLLTYYSLDTGLKWDTLLLRQPLKSLRDAGENALWLLVQEGSQDVLLKWQPLENTGGKSHTDLYYTAEAPDTAGLILCRELAQSLSETYGVTIRIWQDAVATAPWDYAFTPEHRYPVVLSQLQTLEQCLSRYPKEILEQTAGNFDSLEFCLVQSITGTTQGESLSSATGIQFMDGRNVHVVLAAGAYLEQALYHELYHVMELQILSRSGALDRWNELNPAGFSYDYDLKTNAGRNSGVYLENGTRAFVDTYSMSFPKEDRARIFEYAMLPEREYLFRSPIMQRKLQALCTAIREAYGLEASEETLPWEQYLDP